MADIKAKNTDDLSTWTPKELRKLRMVIKNRMSSLELSDKPKDLPSNHPLSNLDIEQVKNLLEKVVKAEKA